MRIKLKRTATLRAVLNVIYLESWAPELSRNTHRRYRHECTRWEKLMGHVPVSEISTETYQQFRTASTAAGHKASSTESTLRFVRSLVRCAYAHGLIDREPDRGKARRVECPDPKPPSVDELEKFLSHVGVARWPKMHVPPGVFWRSLLALGVWTGLRRADLLWHLRWQHVDLTERSIRFSAGKTGVPHVWPIVPVIEWHLDAMRPDWEFPPSRPIFGPSNSPHLVYREMNRICDAAGIRKLGIQTFRQYAVSHWMAAGGEAGAIIHGSAMPRILKHYVCPLTVLQAHADKVQLPPSLLERKAS